MTTIAYRDGVLAADSACVGSDSLLNHTVKIGRIGPILFGASGTTYLCQKFMDWVRRGMIGDHPNNIGGTADNDPYCVGVIMPYGNTVIRFEPGGSLLVHGPYHSEGSGRSHANGAFQHGATPEEAIQAAASRDIYTGGPVQIVRRAHAAISRYPKTKTIDGFTFPYE